MTTQSKFRFRIQLLSLHESMPRVKLRGKQLNIFLKKFKLSKYFQKVHQFEI